MLAPRAELSSNRRPEAVMLAGVVLVTLFAVGQCVVKPFSGLKFRDSNDVDPFLYYHEQTVAVVELGPGRTLVNCELIEVMEKSEQKDLLRNLTRAVGNPIYIKFYQMIDLMKRCEHLSAAADAAQPSPSQQQQQQQQAATGSTSRTWGGTGLTGGLTRAMQSSVFILPETKWCGAGDLAVNYFDLGKQAAVDRCCRTHDLCPVKVKAGTTRYGVTNNDLLVTKLHCACDNEFYSCLKGIKSDLADVMGVIYFNGLRGMCLDGPGKRLKFKPTQRY